MKKNRNSLDEMEKEHKILIANAIQDGLSVQSSAIRRNKSYSETAVSGFKKKFDKILNDFPEEKVPYELVEDLKEIFEELFALREAVLREKDWKTDKRNPIELSFIDTQSLKDIKALVLTETRGCAKKTTIKFINELFKDGVIPSDSE